MADETPQTQATAAGAAATGTTTAPAAAQVTEVQPEKKMDPELFRLMTESKKYHTKYTAERTKNMALEGQLAEAKDGKQDAAALSGISEDAVKLAAANAERATKAETALKGYLEAEIGAMDEVGKAAASALHGTVAEKLAFIKAYPTLFVAPTDPGVVPRVIVAPPPAAVPGAPPGGPNEFRGEYDALPAHEKKQFSLETWTAVRRRHKG